MLQEAGAPAESPTLLRCMTIGRDRLAVSWNLETGSTDGTRCSHIAITDCGAIGWMENYFIFLHPNHQVEGYFFGDESHIRYGHIDRVLRKTGLSFLRTDNSYLVNIFAGPHGQNTNLDAVKECGKELVKNVTIDEPQFQKFYDVMCRDLSRSTWFSDISMQARLSSYKIVASL